MSIVVTTMQWSEVLCCSVCTEVFTNNNCPISLGCGHVICRPCINQLRTDYCPLDQTAITIPFDKLPVNGCLMQILQNRKTSSDIPRNSIRNILTEDEDLRLYDCCNEHLCDLATYLHRAKSERGGSVWSSEISRPMQRKLVSLLSFQLLEPEGRCRAIKAARSLAERSLTELLLMHQNSSHLSSNLWSAVRARGCQFLGPAMQEEVLRLILLALAEGALISRKILVLYIVQTLEKDYPQASKTCVGHVVQLLYRASCFNVIKREGESSLMQLKQEFRNYEALRREHDTQIVQIAMEAGLRISPDQWSSLLYGDQTHRSHMQSIIDKLQSPHGFGQSIQELVVALQRSGGDAENLVTLVPELELLSSVDPAPIDYKSVPTWHNLERSLNGCRKIVHGQVQFCRHRNGRELNSAASPVLAEEKNISVGHCSSTVASQYYRFKTSMCRDILAGRVCPRSGSCTFAHSVQEMQAYRAKNKHQPPPRMTHKDSSAESSKSNRSYSESQRSVDDDDDLSFESLDALSSKSVISPVQPVQIIPISRDITFDCRTGSNIVLTSTCPHVINSLQSTSLPTCRVIKSVTPQPMPTCIPSVTLGQVVQSVTPQPSHVIKTVTPGLSNAVPVGRGTHTNPFVPNTFLAQPNVAVIQSALVDGMACSVATVVPAENFQTYITALNVNQDFLQQQQMLATQSVYCKQIEINKQRLHQLRVKRDEIIRRLSDIQKRHLDRYEDDAERLSHTVATSVLQDDPPPRSPSPKLPFDFGPWKPLPLYFGTTNKKSDIPWLRELTENPGNVVPEDVVELKPDSSNRLAAHLAVLTVQPGYTPTVGRNPPCTVQAPITQVQVRDSLCQPVATPKVQPVGPGPLVSFESVDPCKIAWSLPKVIKGPQSFYPLEEVGWSLDKIVHVKERLDETTDDSATVRHHLRMELDIINRQINNLDKQTEEDCLLKELETVDNCIENFNINTMCC